MGKGSIMQLRKGPALVSWVLLCFACSGQHAGSNGNDNRNSTNHNDDLPQVDAALPDEPDAGATACEEECEAPWFCNPQTRQCECLPDRCCDYVECPCTEGSTTCDGSTLLRCEGDDVQLQGGTCVTVCQYEPVKDCEGSCQEPVTDAAYCAADSPHCGVELTDHFEVSMSYPSWQVNCSDLGGGTAGIGQVAYGPILSLTPNGFMATDDVEVEVEIAHNLPPEATTCLVTGQPTDITCFWQLLVNGCGQSMLITDGQDLLVLAADTTPNVTTGFGLYVEPVELGCPSQILAPCGWPTTQALALYVGSNPYPLLAYQGQSIPFTFDGAQYIFHNLRSFVTGSCIAGREQAYYIAKVCD